MSKSGVEGLEGVTKKGFYMLPTCYLKFYSGNIRVDYGFNPEVEAEVLSLVQANTQVLRGEPSNLNESQTAFIQQSLGDESDVDSMFWLVASIAENGIQEPLRGFKDGVFFVATNGNRRIAALVALGLLGKELPVRVPVRPEQYRNEFDLLQVQVLSNSGRKLSQLDEARVYDKALKLGYEEAEVAKHLANGNIQKVRSRLQLLSLPSQVEQAVRSGVVAPTTAVQLYQKAEADGIPPAVVTSTIVEVIEQQQEKRTGDGNRNGTVRASKSQIQSRLNKTLEQSGSRPAPDSKNLRDEISTALSFDHSPEVLEKVLKILRKSANV